jgi:NAD(P)-dependent dehydrogenase (short-subunit alcohol dehydrogenase family)
VKLLAMPEIDSRRRRQGVSGNRLFGKKILITGAAGSIGRMIALCMADEGARLLLSDQDDEGVAGLAKTINDARGETIAIGMGHDVRNAADWARVVAAATERLGGLSVLVNNAGIGASATIDKLSIDDWHNVMAVNVDGVLLGMKAAMPLLADNTPASIVNISSLATFRAEAEYPAYAASKAAMTMLTKVVALQFARENKDIRCNSIHPGFLRTPLTEHYFSAYGEALAQRKLVRNIPLGRLAVPEDVAWAAVYLASDESRFVTASELKVDGGASA